jgi:hypothetical protein
LAFLDLVADFLAGIVTPVPASGKRWIIAIERAPSSSQRRPAAASGPAPVRRVHTERPHQGRVTAGAGFQDGSRCSAMTVV